VRSQGPGPFDRAFRRLTVGLIAAITLVSFEALGVAAAMPAAAKDLNGEQWYGAAFSLLLLGQLMGTSALGNSIDGQGPRPGFVLGLGVLISGLLVGGFAQHISMLLLSRLLVGVGAGAIFTVGYATVGMSYPDEMRPRVNAAVSSAWVVPGLVGPGVAGWLTDAFSWRVALFAVIPIAVAAGFVVVPALPSTSAAETVLAGPVDGDRFWTLSIRTRTLLGVSAAAGTSLLLVGLANVRWWPLIPLGAAVLAASLGAGLLPRSVFRLELGLGATIAAGAMLIAGYTVAEAFVPLALQRLRGLSSARAGLALTLASITWFVGSWIHGRQPDVMRRGGNARLAIAALIIGVLSIAGMAWSRFPLILSIIGWGIGAIGVGLVYNLMSERPFQLVDVSRVGVASTAVQIANSLGGALSAGIGGALVSVLGEPDETGEIVATSSGLVAAFGLSVAALLLCALIIPRALLGSSEHN
jgi:MFS family permease